jgi:hypothetical protein
MVLRRSSDLQYPKGWPPEELFVYYSAVTRSQLEHFEFLLEKNSSEAELVEFLRDNPDVLVNSLKVLKTGYDGAWVISRQRVRSSMGAIQNGHIPNFIVGGCNPCCFGWYVLEFKGADQPMLSESNNYLHFSSPVNRAIGQVVEYIDYCATAQSFLRESLGLTDFMGAKGLIFVGRESEFSGDPRREKFKAAWNRLMGHRIEIITYDAVLKYVRSEVEFQENRL